MGALYPNAIPQWEYLSCKRLMDCKAIPHQVCLDFHKHKHNGPPPHRHPVLTSLAIGVLNHIFIFLTTSIVPSGLAEFLPLCQQ